MRLRFWLAYTGRCTIVRCCHGWGALQETHGVGIVTDQAQQDYEATKRLVREQMDYALQAGFHHVRGCFMCGSVWTHYGSHTLFRHFPYWIIAMIATSRWIGESNRQAGDDIAIMYHRNARRKEKKS